MKKYYFIINPTAGVEDASATYSEKLREACAKKGIECECIVTEGEGHATKIAAELAQTATQENPVRIFAVGGDGTLFEVTNGLVGKPYCELGCIPCGTGNDYIKCYGDRAEFFDLDSYIDSESIEVDCIRANDLVSINICSLGLDAKICDRANAIKSKHKNMPGSKAYDKAVVRCILGKLYNELKITIDDTQVFEGKYLFSLAASGRCYGGGYYSAPMADPTDGMLDFILIKTVSHAKVPFLVGDYKKGTYLGKRKFRKIVTHVRGKKMRIESKKPAIVTVDGECRVINDMTLEVMPAAVRFVVPKGYLERKKA